MAHAATAHSASAVSRLNAMISQPSITWHHFGPECHIVQCAEAHLVSPPAHLLQRTRQKGCGNLQQCGLCRLDYPGIGPEHSFFKECGRAEYAAATDAEALEAFRLVSRTEGIIPALETSHAFSYLEVRPLL